MHPGPFPVSLWCIQLFENNNHHACIALGSNLGDRAVLIHRALDLLHDPLDLRILAVSNLMETPAVGGPADAPPFLNAAATLSTTMPPFALLGRLTAVEEALGRRRPDRPAAPRTIDLDLLLYDQLIQEDARLTLPHPRMLGRRFVLEPLAQIAPDLIVPGTGETVATLLKALPD